MQAERSSGAGGGVDVNREDLDELHYISPVANLQSILAHGILSHRRAKRMSPQSIAKAEVQEKRAAVKVPGGQRLHEYANLYICARNPMLYLRRSRHQELCVLRIDPAVLDVPGTIVTDQNAASGHALFVEAPGGLRFVDKSKTFAEFWTHQGDQIAEWRHKSMKCAEVLVPDSVSANFIMGAYVSCEASRDQIAVNAPGLPAEVNRHLFFR